MSDLRGRSGNESTGQPGAEVHAYTSTACAHGLHNDCRLRCKWCSAPCQCQCHDDAILSAYARAHE